MPNKQRKPPTDLTGRKQVELQEQHAEELRQREGEIALMNQAQAVVDQEGVFDPATGQRLDGPSTEEVMSSVQYVDDTDEVVDVTGGGDNRPVAQPVNANPTLPGRPAVVEVAPQPVVVSGGQKKIRVNSKLEDVTIGQGNHFTFEEGKTYLVDAHVAQHLEEKGYVYH